MIWRGRRLPEAFGVLGFGHGVAAGSGMGLGGPAARLLGWCGGERSQGGRGGRRRRGDGAQADGGDPEDGDIVWGVLVHQTDAPPVAVDALAGLHVVVSDRMQPPGPLSTTLDWPAASAGSMPDVQVLHDCTAGKAPLEISVRVCAPSPDAGCLDLLFKDPGVSGTFTHPNGDVCEIQGGDAELFVRALHSEPVPQEFAASDTATGTFRLRCVGTGGMTLWLDRSFALRVRRMFLLC